MFFTGDKTFISFAQGTILVVAIAMFASVTVLPAILAWLGDRVEKGRIPFLAKRRTAGQSRFWSAVIDRVMRRPWLSIALAGGALLALAIPALNMKIVRPSPDDLPQDLPIIQTYNKRARRLPGGGVDGRRRGPGATSATLRHRHRDRAAAPQAAESPDVLPGIGGRPTARTTRSR